MTVYDHCEHPNPTKNSQRILNNSTWIRVHSVLLTYISMSLVGIVLINNIIIKGLFCGENYIFFRSAKLRKFIIFLLFFYYIFIVFFLLNEVVVSIDHQNFSGIFNGVIYEFAVLHNRLNFFSELRVLIYYEVGVR